MADIPIPMAYWPYRNDHQLVEQPLPTYHSPAAPGLAEQQTAVKDCGFSKEFHHLGNKKWIGHTMPIMLIRSVFNLYAKSFDGHLIKRPAAQRGNARHGQQIRVPIYGRSRTTIGQSLYGTPPCGTPHKMASRAASPAVRLHESGISSIGRIF